jgi:hypothetical protein
MDDVRSGSSTVALVIAAALSAVGVSHAQSAASGPAGRWEFTIEAPTSAGRGRGTGAQTPATRTVTLKLEPGPGGTLGGTVAIPGSGRSGGTGGNPLRPVEISDGKVDGSQLSFSVWQFDGYKNRMRYDGLVNGDRLTLTMTRDTANGTERTEAVAVRKPY